MIIVARWPPRAVTVPAVTPPTPDTAGSETAARIAAAYASDGPAIELGSVVHGGDPHPEAPVGMPLAMLNRHGLIAGATGTGKTKTLQLIAEQLSAAGVPVVLADIKGDPSDGRGGIGLSGPAGRPSARCRTDRGIIRPTWVRSAYRTATGYNPRSAARAVRAAPTARVTAFLRIHHPSTSGAPRPG